MTIREIYNVEEIRPFVADILADPVFGAPALARWPHLYACKLTAVAASPRDRLLGVYRGGALLGVFSFLLLPDERYAECLCALSREAEAYRAAFGEIRKACPGWLFDCVCPAENRLYRDACAALGGRFETPQLALRMDAPHLTPGGKTARPYSPEYEAGYRAIHVDEDMYWTAERVLADGGFDVYLALDGDRVIGYADVRRFPEAEDEVYNVVVLPEYRKQGYGRALMLAALSGGDARKMYLQVDEDNAPALALYRSLGFREQPEESTVTVHIAL